METWNLHEENAKIMVRKGAKKILNNVTE
jgi:hypothetical protein